jgi:signal transduction histidine kinase
MKRPFRNIGMQASLLVFWVTLVSSLLLALSAQCWQGWALFGVVTGAALFYVYLTYRRYRLLADMADEISAILHGNDTLRLERYKEGELSILQSEVAKMTVRLREQAERLSGEKERLSDAIADISHQLRTPLTSVRLLASLLEEPGLPESRRDELLSELNTLLDRISWLIEVLLKLSKLDAGMVSFRNDQVMVSELVEKAAAPLAVSMEVRNQQLDVTLEANPAFCGDLLWSAEAVGNILKNCMEHTPYGGKIFVHARENAMFTEIQISDTGPGIPKAEQNRVFDRFFKGKNASPSSVGIGLALAKQIITSQNGTVKVLDRPGGACFAIRFYKGVI